mmetsp:Transcript_3447/g.8106  ORF Transcript_3447/g.8106 Transcript_3447/m.8106 type:complete len:559 (-) Transcript_3447:211-1887(-)
MAASELDMALHRSVMERRRPIEEQIAAEDAKRRADWYAEREALGGAKLTKEKIKKLLRSDRKLYYSTPQLNEKIYLHFGGYTKIENLEEFTEMRAMYLESNAIEKIEGLESMKKLRSLFIQENCLKSIDGLLHMDDLQTLNCCNNFIYKIENLPPSLTTLQIANNQLGHEGLDDVRALVGTKISVLDLQGNKIKEPELVEEVLQKMPDLKVLYLKGNPVVSAIKSYRKRVIAALPNLSYLDDRPVFKDERRFSEAFVQGGLEAERAERKAHKEEERAQHKRQMDSFKQMCDEAKRSGRERRAMMAHDKYDEDTDPVDTWERRCRRSVQGWEEENKELLKDEGQEKAAKVLKLEKEQGVGMYDPKLQEAYAKDGGGEKNSAASTSIPSRWHADYNKSAAAAKGKEKKQSYGDVWDDDAIVFDAPGQSDSSTVSDAAAAAAKMTPAEIQKNMGALLSRLGTEEKKAVEEILAGAAGAASSSASGGGAPPGSVEIVDDDELSTTVDGSSSETGSTSAKGAATRMSITEAEDTAKPAFSFNPRSRAPAPAKKVIENELDELD